MMMGPLVHVVHQSLPGQVWVLDRIALLLLVLDPTPKPHSGFVGLMPWRHRMGVKKYLLIQVVYGKHFSKLLGKAGWPLPLG